ncbi:MAG TPA: type III-B CRISPR module RAMP protein Cmr4 [Fervidobacterium sp.]|nr:type III-B CRISPR module RAMP protein Cmr4 [Fervidobacterium sp.]HOL04182.1 type III-B CRISPR module RAMP protein Cmr4 [Fervidobacterium sp.]
MYKKFQPFFLIVETPLHAGSGSELGVLDLPIQRERYTNFPKIEGSSLKGAIREAFETTQNGADIISLVFGPEDGDIYAGAIGFTDAKVLCFPVKSLRGVFAWVTCPMVLNRFIEDMHMSGQEELIDNWDLSNVTNTVSKGSQALISDKIVLEEFTFQVRESDMTTKIANALSEFVFPGDAVYAYWKEKMKKDLVILSDEDFEDFVSTSTEVITRTRISNETGTVETGALWTEEFLPQDTILYSIAMATPVRAEPSKKKELLGDTSDEEAEKVIEFFKKGLPRVINIGGDQTIGKGIVRTKLLGGLQ